MNVYVANLGDDTVIRVPKAGGNATTLVTGWKNVVGVAVSGTNLFWSSESTFGNAGVSGNFGGVWKCTLPACTDKNLISTVGNVRHLDAKNGYVYYAASSDVRRVKEDGTGDMTIAAVNSPFSVAADATHVYYTSNQNNVGRALVTGGVDESVGPLTSKVTGFISVTADRFFWAYTDVSSKGQAFGALKSATATRVSYGNANQASIAITSDAKNVYWANDGSNTGIDSNGDGELLSCPVAGCGSAEPVRLVDKLHYAGPIIVDGSTIYFLEFGGRGGANGRLLKIAAP